MNFYSVWPYFGAMAIILAIACTPLLQWADTPPTTVPARVRTIDGLRGFLALSVLFHHAAIYHQYLQTGTWDLPPSRFYANLGQFGVAMFFMITGYLFWAQMLKARGRPNLTKLFVGRIFRIAPLYLFLVVIILLTAGVFTQWHLVERPRTVAMEVARWLTSGVIGGGDVNHYADTARISAYVTWTLHYEWLFYGSLAVTSLFARSRILGILLPFVGLLVAALVLQIYPDNFSTAAVLMFCVGMTAASAKREFAKARELPQWALSTGIVGCVALVLLSCKDVSSTLPILILAVAFVLVIFGGTLFGLLLSRPAKRLGAISYGIYLLQGPVFFYLFAPASVRSWAIESVGAHWTLVIIAALLLTLLATATHALIERPGIVLGQWALKNDRIIWPSRSVQGGNTTGSNPAARTAATMDSA
jgi:peptidoglycan/LPS O-acetylase OafA/YrhL